MKTILSHIPLSILIGLISVYVWFGCAQQVAPQGGPQDLTPPELLESVPANFSTSFDAQKIELTFDEFVRLKDVAENILFSPVLKHDPDFLEKGKKLVITLYDTLQENTTYTINFNDAIVDITEENPLSGFQYIFSTGTYIDSLTTNGSIINAYSLKPEKNIAIMLYESFDDSIPYKVPPRYITKSNEEGKFEITNIKSGVYKAIALMDRNRNYLIDPGESIGFSDSLISIDADSMPPKINFVLFKETKGKQYLKKYGSKAHRQFMLKFNQPAENVQIREFKKQTDLQSLLKETNARQDSLVYWIYPPTTIDTVWLEITMEDTLVDTVIIPIMEKSKKKVTAQISSNGNEGSRFNLDDPLKISSPVPMTIDTSKIELFEDSIEVGIQWVSEDSAKKTYMASYPWKENTSYQLILLPEAVSTIYNDKNDSLKFKMLTRELKFYGTLKLQLPSLDESAVLLLTRNEQTIDTNWVNSSKKELLFEYLHPGKYGLTIIHDENKNGKWDTGDYLNHQQPEKVTIYPGTITIRSNWDQEVEWLLE